MHEMKVTDPLWHLPSLLEDYHDTGEKNQKHHHPC